MGGGFSQAAVPVQSVAASARPSAYHSPRRFRPWPEYRPLHLRRGQVAHELTAAAHTDLAEDGLEMVLLRVRDAAGWPAQQTC
jgi:hypothetical protein